MATQEYLLTKGGPRLLDFLVDANEIDVLVTGPGMLFQRLELVTSGSALEGCDAGFFQEVAARIEGTVYCGHTPPEPAAIEVQPHRAGAELRIEFGPPSMYQSLLKLRTRSGRTFREVVEEARGDDPGNVPRPPIMAALNVIRATTHHDHHASAKKAIHDQAAAHGSHAH